MKIALASDHTGVAVRKKIRALLEELGVEYQDLGCTSEGFVDYPDMADRVARAVSRKAARAWAWVSPPTKSAA